MRPSTRRAALAPLALAAVALAPAARAQPAPQPPPVPVGDPYQADPVEFASRLGRVYPVEYDRWVNDFAGLIEPATRFAIRGRLKELEAETEQRVTVVTYPDPRPFGGQPDPIHCEALARRLYAEWRLAGEVADRPGHLLAIGRDPRHVLYLTGEGYRFAWVREATDHVLDTLPIDLRHAEFSRHLAEVLGEVGDIARENHGADWATVLPTVLLALGAYGAYVFLQRLRDEEPPPPPPKELARPRAVGAPAREVTADDLFVDLRKGKR